MEVDVKVRIKNTRSADIFGLFRSALDGLLTEKNSTEEGQAEIQKMMDKALDDVANQAFNLGRKYEQDA